MIGEGRVVSLRPRSGRRCFAGAGLLSQPRHHHLNPRVLRAFLLQPLSDVCWLLLVSQRSAPSLIGAVQLNPIRGARRGSGLCPRLLSPALLSVTIL